MDNFIGDEGMFSLLKCQMEKNLALESEILKLNEYFIKIKDQASRKLLIEIAKELGGDL
jgi:hypothetical protein